MTEQKITMIIWRCKLITFLCHECHRYHLIGFGIRRGLMISLLVLLFFFISLMYLHGFLNENFGDIDLVNLLPDGRRFVKNRIFFLLQTSFYWTIRRNAAIAQVRRSHRVYVAWTLAWLIAGRGGSTYNFLLSSLCCRYFNIILLWISYLKNLIIARHFPLYSIVVILKFGLKLRNYILRTAIDFFFGLF